MSSSENIFETFGYVPDVQSAEKLLHEHELETTTSFVMYYNCGVGKGALQTNSGSCCMLGLGVGVGKEIFLYWVGGGCKNLPVEVF